MDYHPSLCSCWGCAFISSILSDLSNSIFRVATRFLKTEESWMVTGPENNLHGGGDICKSKAVKIYTPANDSNCKPDKITQQVGVGHRDDIGIDIIGKNG